jgi:4-amino-4-deoxy-L-arabinose transferase-like glycosyltransferase
MPRVTGQRAVKTCKRERRWLGWIVLALCLLSFARGVYQLGERSLWWDESLSHHRAARPFSFILSNRMLFLYGAEETPVTPDQHPPLYFVLLRLVILAAGDSEFALRYLSLAACVLIVPILYQCGRHLYDRATGVGAALLAACTPLYLWAQQEARPYALATLLAATSFYALLRVLADPPSGLAAGSGPARQRWWGALYILSTLAMLATHYHALQLLPAQAGIYVLARGHHKRRALWALLATGVVAGGIALYGLRKIVPAGAIPGYVFVPLGTLLQDVLRSFPLGVSGTHLVPYQWVSVGLLLVALGVLFTRRRGPSRRHAAYLLLCFALPVGEIYAVSYVRPVYMNIRHLAFASPFYYLLLAAGAAQARHIRLGRAARISLGMPVGVAMGVLLVGMGLSTHTYFSDPLYDKEDHRGWGRYLSEHVRPGDVVLVNPGAVYELYTYYSSSPAPYYGIPLPGATAEQTVQQLLEIGKRYDRVWIAQSMTPYWANPGDVALRWLEENALRLECAKFGGSTNTVQACAFSLEPPVTSSLPEKANPLALDFDGQLRLLGYHLDPEPVEGGHTLRLSLYWSAARPLDHAYRFTLALTDGAGTSWSSLDHMPYDGTYPTAQWPVGRIVRDDIDIDVPLGTPPGRYRLKLSAYPADRSSPSLAVRELDSGRLRGLIVSVAEIDVVSSGRPPLGTEVTVAHRVRRRYGDVALLGHDYSGGTYRHGDVVSLDLYWRATRAPRQDLTFSLQLTDQNGEIRATHTIAPVEGYPTSRWTKGELVQGKHRFRIPLDVPPGDYSLWLAPDGGYLRSAIWPWSDRRVRLDALSVLLVDDERTLEIPPMQHVLRAILGDRVELLGYDLEASAIRPSQVVSCTLYWRGLQEMDRDYTVFTHLVAPDGSTWGQWDNQPQRGRSPTTRWIPGQVVADPYQIPLSDDAPAGPLTLRVGMYDLLEMTRLPVLDESGTLTGDSVAVAEIEVVDGRVGRHLVPTQQP